MTLIEVKILNIKLDKLKGKAYVIKFNFKC